jgi:glycosyltransferase involved in cell wall biosynthesis
MNINDKHNSINSFHKHYQSEDICIAWLLPSFFYYWQPTIAFFSQLFPNTIVFTSKWHGFAPGLKNTFQFEIVGKRRILKLSQSDTGYGLNFTHLSFSIISRLIRFCPDVIFTNSFGLWTCLSLLFKPIYNWKVIIAYEGASPSVDFRSSRIRLFVRRLMVKFADACITNSAAGKSYLFDCLRVQENRIFSQPYEVPAISSIFDCSINSDSELLNIRRPVFLFVGSLIPRKGLYYLVEACTILNNRNCKNYTLLIVGDGPQRVELQSFCSRHELSGQVRWMGHVDYSHLENLFKQSDVFVLPTLEDTWGMVVLEAMSFAKAILCSRSAGAVELVSEGENGFCFDAKDSSHLAELMYRFIDLPALSLSMGAKSQQIMTRYSPEIAAHFLGKVVEFCSIAKA